MSSVRSNISQPLTRTFRVDPSGQKLFLQSDIDAWAENRARYIDVVGNTYICKPTSSIPFKTIVAGTISAYTTKLGATGATLLPRTTLKDLGSEIRIGIASAPSLLVLRKVQTTGPSASNGTPDNFDTTSTGYTVIENNSNDVFATKPEYFEVAVSRV